jgi:hypothetical protein
MNQLGNVNAFGLDEMGQPVGLNPVWGAVVGTGLGTVAAIGTRQFTKYGKHSELVGFGVGALASGAMIAFEGTRAAGWTGLASAFLNNGLRQLELMFFKPDMSAAAEAVEQAAAAANSVNGVVIEPTQALRGVAIERTQSLLGNPNEGLPQLVGANLSAANEHVQLVGGPALAQHSGAWGATIIPS